MEQESLNDYQENIIDHYKSIWKCNDPAIYLFDKGSFDKLPYDFRVLEFPPNFGRDMWTYATCCMSQLDDYEKIEVHLFSKSKDVGIIELLTALAYYHRNTKMIGLNHTVNFGQPWVIDSNCKYGLISLPYLDGPKLENYLVGNNESIKFYWLIPITEEEVIYKRTYGIEALETKFDNNFNYLNPLRKSVV